MRPVAPTHIRHKQLNAVYNERDATIYDADEEPTLDKATAIRGRLKIISVSQLEAISIKQRMFALAFVV